MNTFQDKAKRLNELATQLRTSLAEVIGLVDSDPGLTGCLSVDDFFFVSDLVRIGGAFVV